MPDWLPKALMKLVELSRLKENWDSYGGYPPTSLALGCAVQFLGVFADRQWPVPHIVPCSNGRIQFEWSELELTVGHVRAFAKGLWCIGDGEFSDVTLDELCERLSEVFDA